MSGTFQITIAEARGYSAVAANVDQLCLVMGCSSSATGLSPFYGNGRVAKAALGYGDAVDTLCQIIEQVQPDASVKIPACFYDVPAVTDGAYGTIDVTGVTGSSVVTNDSSVKPYGTYEAYLIVRTGGDVGTTGIEFQWSLDGGRTLSPITALGTATSYTITEANIKFSFATGDLHTGDVIQVRTTAPIPDAAGLTTAFAAIAAASIQVGVIVCDFPMTSTLAAAVTTGKAALKTAGKDVTILGRTRSPNYGSAESDATWNAAVKAAFLAVYDSGITLCAGDLLVTDAMTGRRYLRNFLQQGAAEVARVGRSKHPCAPADRKMANVSLIDDDGVTIGHDEGPRGASTGLSDDAQNGRFWCVQRLASASRMEEVYTTVPWTLYAADERIRTLPVRRLANAMERVTRDSGVPLMGLNIPYTAATETTPATLTALGERIVHKQIFTALRSEFLNDIQNAEDGALDTGLVQVNPIVTVTGGNLLRVPVTISPRVFGEVIGLDVTMAIVQ